MKKILVSLIIVVFTASLFSQQINKKAGKKKIDFEKQDTTLKSENIKLKDENVKLKASHNTLNVKIKGFQTINNNLNKQIKILKKKDSENQLKMANFIIENQKLNDEKVRLTNQIGTLKKVILNLRNNIKSLNGVIEKRDDRIDKLKDENANLKIDLNTKEKLREQYVEMSSLKNKANMIIANLQEKNKKLKDENLLIKYRLDKFKRSTKFNKKLQEENITMKKKIEELSNSNAILKDYNERLKARKNKKLIKK